MSTYTKNFPASEFKAERVFGATPLDRDEAQGLIPSHIATQADLNAAEQSNILEARVWALATVSGPRSFSSVLDETFVRRLHQRMFGEVWSWAGTYRKSQKSIGIDWPLIGAQVRELCLNARYWIENGVYAGLELAARVHHRLVYVHPFPNGNGRHARLFTECLVVSLGHDAELLGWGRGQGSGAESGRGGGGGDRALRAGELRATYIAALQAADRRDFGPLLRFIGASSDVSR